MLFPSWLIVSAITWIFSPFMECSLWNYNQIMIWLFNRTDNRNILPLHGPLYCGTLNEVFLLFLNHTVYMSIWQLHGNIPFGAPLCLYLWIDNHTYYLNTSQLHGLCLCELLNWLVFWLVNHTGYRNRIHPLGTLLTLLKTILLPFIARSIFRIIFYLSKTYVTLSANISFVNIVITCKSIILKLTLFNLCKTIFWQQYSNMSLHLILFHFDWLILYVCLRAP